MNKFCFGAIYNGRLWEKDLGVSALNHVASRINVVLEPDRVGLMVKSAKVNSAGTTRLGLYFFHFVNIC